VEADGRPLFHFVQPLLRGLTFASGSGSASDELQRIDSDTADQRLIQNRLVLVGLPPLRADASDAELRADLDAIMADLIGRGVIRPLQLLWIARVAPTPVNGASSSSSGSAVIQLDHYQRQMVVKMAVFRRSDSSIGRSAQLNSWVRGEVARLNEAWRGTAERQVCQRHFERYGDQSCITAPGRCRLGDACTSSHRLEDLRRLQQRDRESAAGPGAAMSLQHSDGAPAPSGAEPSCPEDDLTPTTPLARALQMLRRTSHMRTKPISTHAAPLASTSAAATPPPSARPLPAAPPATAQLAAASLVTQSAAGASAAGAASHSQRMATR